MYAMTKHIKKAMAAFLCACLLLSYNPAAGMVPAAEAAVGDLTNDTPTSSVLDSQMGDDQTYLYDGLGNALNGDASTDVNITTFSSGLKTEASDGFSGTIDEIEEAGQELIVNALSPRATGKKDYGFAWTVSTDGGDPVTIPETNFGKTIWSSSWDGVAHSTLNMTNLFEWNFNGISPAPAPFSNGHEYVFKCTVKAAGVDKPAVERIVVTTVPTKDYGAPDGSGKKYISADDGTAASIGEDASGGFLKDAKLQSAPMKPVDEQNYYGKLFAAGAAALPADPEYPDYDYQVGPIQANSITSESCIDETTGVTLPAYVGALTMWIPVEKTVDGREYNYEENDKIYVLYKKPGETEGAAQWVEATVLPDPNGGNKLKATFTINDVTGPYMPGYFALAYAPSEMKENSSGKPVAPITSYTISAEVTSGSEYGTITSTAALENGIWTTGDDATYTFTPRASKVEDNTVTTYAVKSISFGAAGDELKSIDLSRPDVFTVNGNPVVAQYADGVLTLTGCVAGGQYKLEAEFDVARTYTTNPDDDPNLLDPTDTTKLATYNVFVSMVDEKGGNGIGNSVVTVNYSQDGGNLTITDGAATLSKTTSDVNVTSPKALAINAVTHTTTRFNVGESNLGDKTYYLKEIKVGSNPNSLKPIEPISLSSTVTDDVNGDPIYVQFVIGERQTTYEPATTFEATFTVAGGNGSIEGAADDGTLTQDFQVGMPGASVTFNGAPASDGKRGYYADYAVVKNDNGDVLNSHESLDNSDCLSEYSWSDYTAYPFDVTFEVHFSEIRAIKTYSVWIDENIEHGTIAPSGWTLDNDKGYRAGTELVFNVKADEGYKLTDGAIIATMRDGSVEKLPVTAGLATLKVKGEVINLTATFEAILATEKPKVFSEPFDLGIYVADSTQSGLWDLIKQSTDNDSVKPSGSSKIDDSMIDMKDYSSASGKIFGESQINTVVTATKADGYPTYPLSMLAAPGYEVEKVLVVKYTSTESDGTKTKIASSRTLYNIAWPTFDVTNIDSDTDVVVYFRKLATGEKPSYSTPETVTVTSIYAGVATPVNTEKTTFESGKAVSVVKGQGYMNRIVPSSDARWSSLFWSGDGLYVAKTDEVIDTANVYTVNLPSVEGNVYVSASFRPYVPAIDGDEAAKTFTLSAPSGLVGGSVKASVGTTSDRTLGSWSSVAQGSGATILVKAEQTRDYYISALQFTIDPAKGQDIWVDTGDRKMAFGSQPSGGNWTKVTATEGVYTFGAVLGTDKKTYESEWTVENLQGNIFIAPTFALASGSGSGTGDGEGDDNGGVDQPIKADNYEVNATVGKGIGTIYSPQAPDGFPLLVPNDADRTVRMWFTPGKTAKPAELPYEIENVTVKKDGTLLDNIAEVVATALPFIESDTQRMARYIKEDGFLELAPVDGDYDIVVDFKIADYNYNGEEIDNTAKLDSQVMVNAEGNAFKGVITPSSSVVSKSGKDSTQQFIVSPYRSSENGMFYSVESVVVTADGKSPTTIDAGKNDTCLTWDTTYANVFTVNVEALDLDDKAFQAVTVTVNYSDEANVSGNIGAGGSSQTPPLSKMKKVSIDIEGMGKGLVNPAGGPFYFLCDSDWSSQRVTVSAEKGSHLSKITVERLNFAGNFVEDEDLSSFYYNQALNEGYFQVSTLNRGEEIITVYFETDNIMDRTYALWASSNDKIDDGTPEGITVPGIVVPHDTVVRLQPDEEYTFTADPKQNGWAVKKITDSFMYKKGELTAEDVAERVMRAPADWAHPEKWTETEPWTETGPDEKDRYTVVIPQDVQGSVTWTRSAEATADKLGERHNLFNASAVNVEGLGNVDRQIFVEFADYLPADTPNTERDKDKYDFTGPDMTDENGNPTGDGQKDPNAKQVDLRVNTWGPGRDDLTITPNKCLLDVYWGNNREYPYLFYVNDGARDNVNNGNKGFLRIYCVEVNGTVLFGSKTELNPHTQLATDYTWVFSEENMAKHNVRQRDVNVLNVYVHYFTQGQLDADKVTLKNGEIEVGSSSGGDVLERNPTGGYSVANKSAAAASVASLMMDDRAEYATDQGETNSNPDGSPTTPTNPEMKPSETDDKKGEIEDDQDKADETDQKTVGGNEIGGSYGDDTPLDYYMVPGPNYVVDDVFMFNCEVVDFAWVKPQDVPNESLTGYQDLPTVLKCSIVRTDANEKGYVFVKYRYVGPYSEQTKAEWDKWQDPEGNEYGYNFVTGNVKKNKLDRTIEVTFVQDGDKALKDLGKTVTQVIRVDDEDAQNADWYKFTTTSGDESGKVKYRTKDFNQDTGDFTVLVGPLIDWNETDNSKSVLYTIEDGWAEGDASNNLGLTVTPVKAGTKEPIDDDDETATTTDESTLPKYYQNYMITGNVKDFPKDLKNQNDITINVPVVKKTLQNGTYPEFQKKESGNKPNEGDNQGTTQPPTNTITDPVKITVRMVGNGSLTPHTYDGVQWWGTQSTSGNTWTVQRGSWVAFGVSTDTGYRLTGLTRNGTDCFESKEYSFPLRIVAFQANVEENVLVPEFKANSEAMVTITYELRSTGGTIEPASGRTQRVLIGDDTPTVTFKPESSSYVPGFARTIVDGTASEWMGPLTADKLTWKVTDFTGYSGVFKDTTVQVTFRLAGSDDNNPLIHTAGQDLIDSSTGLIRTGDSLWLAVALVVIAAGAVTTVMVVRRRKAAASRAARAAKYSVTPRKRR